MRRILLLAESNRVSEQWKTVLNISTIDEIDVIELENFDINQINLTEYQTVMVIGCSMNMDHSALLDILKLLVKNNCTLIVNTTARFTLIENGIQSHCIKGVVSSEMSILQIANLLQYVENLKKIN